MSDTRDRLLSSAEELFAEKGIDGTSVREVNALAGQRNTSAIRYHFDGMSGLLEALIALRMGALDDARAEALQGLLEGSARPEVRIEECVAVLVLPLAERVHADPGWARWVRVLAQLISVRGQEHRPLWEGRFDKTTRAVFEMIRERELDVPELEWQQRVDDMMMLCIGSLCERVCKLERDHDSANLSAREYTSNLVRTATAVLQSPR